MALPASQSVPAMLTRDDASSRPDDKEFMATLAKGLAVLGCFGKQRPAMTLSEAAIAANVSRATARRILRTLTELGYVEQHGRQFSLSPNILQLGFLDPSEIWRRLKSLRIEPFTPSTITDLQALFDRIRDDHEQGFSIVDEELERGLRALAVPVVDRQSQVVAALNLSTHSMRTTRNEMREKFLPELRAIAAQISPFVA